ncbi:hypothetical protein HAX54_027785, partial [Datura stramonium]|nr:hypothetical protein [Datura stramonium]
MLQATALTPRYISDSGIEASDSPIHHRFSICYPSSLFLIDGSATVNGHPPAVRRCFTGAASSLDASSSS